MEHKCCNCNRDYGFSECKYKNAERILRLEKGETCPFWLPVKLGGDTGFVKEVERKSAIYEAVKV